MNVTRELNAVRKDFNNLLSHVLDLKEKLIIEESNGNKERISTYRNLIKLNLNDVKYQRDLIEGLAQKARNYYSVAC